MAIDVHVHSRGKESTADILKAMDEAGIDKIFSTNAMKLFEN
jgi:predicted metal-dependent TIM-barrel fold hydrolase